MDGILNVRKPCGPTSHDVVDQVRRVFRQRKVGHAGTLDPMADGVLVVCLGKATKLIRYFESTQKEYLATARFGIRTDTQDSSGQVIDERDASGVVRGDVEALLPVFTGEIEQVPPMVSALKYKGRRLYELARRGEEVERKPRRVIIYELRLVAFRPGPHPEADFFIKCSSGTYIRTLCADIGDRLGCGAHVTRLTRTRVGPFEIDSAVTLDQLQAAAPHRLSDLVIGMNYALSHLPAAVVSASDLQKVVHGGETAVLTDADLGETVRLVSGDGVLLAVGLVDVRRGEKIARPKTVLVEVS